MKNLIRTGTLSDDSGKDLEDSNTCEEGFAMQKAQIYVVEKSYPDYSEERRIIEKAGGALLFARCRTEEDIIAQCSGAHALLLRQTPIGEKAFRLMGNLLVISRYGVGYDNVDVEAATRHGVLVTVVPDYCVGEVADHAIALLMSAIRRIPLRDRFMRLGCPDIGSEYTVHRTKNRILGIAGYGKTGREVRKRLSGFPFHFIACDPAVPKERFADDRTARVDFKTLLKLSDYLTVHVPLNASTERLFNEAAFRSMKRGAILVNCSRGGVVESRALFDALNRGHIAGAALDVYESEPLEPDHPLRLCGNLILSDHSAWYSEESLRELQTRASQEVANVLSGIIPENVVNPEACLRIQPCRASAQKAKGSDKKLALVV
jgi:D-3-phosphoglycerate dehydrogenase